MYALFYLSCLLLQAGEDFSSLSSTSVDSSNSRTPSPSQSELSSSDIDIDSFLGPEHHPCNPSLLTYRLVGDNILLPLSYMYNVCTCVRGMLKKGWPITLLKCLAFFRLPFPWLQNCR